MPRRQAMSLLSLLLVAACAAPATTRPPKALASAAPAATALPAKGVSASLGPTAPLAVLSGRVTAPAALLAGTGLTGASIVGNNGGGVISDQGSGIVGNNSGGYRLAAAPTQLAVQGATVRLLDAAGVAVKDAKGEPLTAKTDASGRYAFASAPTTHNLVLAASLAGKGALTAAVAHDAPPQVDVDLVSTLTTTYILEKYVATQADAVQTFDRLPGAIEAATRVKAGLAIAAGGPLPDDLTPAQVLGAVERLRQGDPAFDAQLEVVKQLLILAGQSDLGEGEPATSVDLAAVERLWVGKNGALYVVTAKRIWRLDADGRLRTAYDGGASAALADAALDAQGRLLVLLPATSGDPYRVVRREADGHDTPIGSLPAVPGAGAFPLGLLPGAGDEVLVAASGYAPGSASLAALPVAQGDRLWSIAPGRAATVALPLPSGPGSARRIAGPVGRAADGTIAALGDGEDVLAVTLAPGASAFELLVGNVLSGAGLFGTPAPAAKRTGSAAAIAPTGEVLTVDLAGVSRVKPDGSAVPLVSPLPPGLTGGQNGLLVAAFAPDGSAYLAGADLLADPNAPWLVYRVAGGVATLVAGKPTPTPVTTPTPAFAGAVALHAPTGVALAAGHIRVLDDQQVLAVAADGKTAPLATFQPAALNQVAGRLAADAAGNLYALQAGAFTPPVLYRLDAHGAQTKAYEGPPGGGGLPSTERVLDFACLPDGRLAVLVDRGFGTAEPKPTLLLGAPGQLQATTLDATALGYVPNAVATLGLAPNGRLLLATAGKVFALDAQGAATSFAATGPAAAAPRFAVDATGRLYFADAATVVRYDPAIQARVTVAGAGTPNFAGSGVDDGLAGATDLAFAPDGALLILDAGHKQLKRVPPGSLPP